MKPRGLSVLEVLIAAVILVVVFFAFQRVAVSFFQGLQRSQTHHDRESNLLTVTSNLQKFIPPGDLRFFGFSGRPGDRVLGRFVLPRPGYCGNLTPNCGEDTSLMYLHYERSLAPAVTAICSLDARTWLVDIVNANYGVATLAPTNDGFDVAPGATSTYAFGKVAVDRNKMVGLANTPSISLWLFQGRPVRHNVALAALPADCQRNLQPPNRIDGLYRVAVEPMFLTPVTGGSTATDPERLQAMGKFPMRIFNVSIRNVGLNPTGSNPRKMGIHRCTSTGTTFNCEEDALFSVTDVTRLRIMQSFKLTLTGSNAQVYQVLDAAQAPWNCDAPRCAALRAPASVPVAYGGTEAFDSLSPASFSLLKQESLSKLDFRIAHGTKQESFHVIFP